MKRLKYNKIEKKSMKNENSNEFNVEIDNLSQNNLSINLNENDFNEMELKDPETNVTYEKMEIEEPNKVSKIKKPNPFKNKSAKKNFIKRVYLVLFGQLISSFIIFLLLNKK